MSITNSDNSIKETGNGIKVAFDFNFKIYEAADLIVYKINVTTLVRTLQVYGSDYTVSISAPSTAEGGTVTYIVAPTSGEQSYLERAIEYTQTVNVPVVGAMSEKQLEKGFDKLCILILQLLQQVRLSLKFVSSSSHSDIIIPEPAADQVLGWNSLGTTLENKTLTLTTTTYPGLFSAGADASKPASPGAKDIYIATDTYQLYICQIAGSWEKFSPEKNSLVVFKTGHGFSAKDVLSHNGTNYVKATADSAADAATMGIVTKVLDANNFILSTGGYIDGLSGLVAGTQYFLSPSVAGLLTVTKPSAAGQIIKPIFYAISTTAGFLNVSYSDPVASTPAFEGSHLHIQDQKTANTDGGTFTSAAWRTRDLNTVVTNQITGASLATNQITLPAGTYEIDAVAPAVSVLQHKAKLRNITDSSDVILGTSELAINNGGNCSRVMGRFTIAGAKVFELQHQCNTTAATSGFGSKSNFSVIEVYSDVRIWKVA